MHGGHGHRDAVINVSTTAGERLISPADNEKEARETLRRQHRRHRSALFSLIVLDAVLSIVLTGAVLNFKFDKLITTKYSLEASLLDALIITLARCISLSTQTWCGWWLGAASSVLAVCKAIVYSHTTQPTTASAQLFLAIVFALAELRATSLCMSCHRRRVALDKLRAEAEAEGLGLDSDKYEPKLRPLIKPPKSSLRGTWKILRPYFFPTGLVNKVRTLATFFVMGGSKACNLLAPLYIGTAAQTLVDGKLPYVELGIYCALRFGSSALKELQSLVYIRVKQNAFAEIAEGTFRHLLGLSLDWHLRKKMGEVLRVMDRGISSADSVMNYLILFLGPSLVECIVTLVLFFTHFRSPKLSAVALISFTVYIVLTVQITQWRKKFRTGQNKQDNKYHDLATDSLVNFETVKYFANEDYEVGQFTAAVRSFQSYNIGVQASLSLLNSLQQLDIQLTTLVALCLAASTILHTSRGPHDEVQIGEFVAVNAYIVQLFAPLSFLGTIYSTVIQAFIDMHNLSELLTLSPDVKDAPHAPLLKLTNPQCGATVEFDAVDFSYPTQQSRGLRALSFTTPAGSTTAIVGPTGAGKSTISRLLFRFYDVTAGQVRVDGQDVRRVSQRSLRGAIGVVPQDTVLFNASIEKNIRYGMQHASMEQVEAAARGAQILQLIESLEAGWETVVGERGLRLSGGEKQRVAIARCLLKNPPIVLLDEATSALDSATEVAVQAALETLGSGRTQLVVAHRLSTIAGARQILVLDAGRLVESGGHAALLGQSGLYRRLWDAQQEAALRAAQESPAELEAAPATA